jgi:hypothetical protein
LQKRSHTLLASALLRSQHGFQAKRFEWAFLFGSFEPDCNPLSYLKGSLRGKKFGGHNFTNSQRYIFSQIRRLQSRSNWTIWQYYTLGKLTHYLADAFTYPHNDHFPDGLLDHHRYETNLRLEFANVMSQRSLQKVSYHYDLISAISDLHREYLAYGSDQGRDIQYIVLATELLMTACQPAVAA